MFSEIKFTIIQNPSPMNRNQTRKTFVFLLTSIIMLLIPWKSSMGWWVWSLIRSPIIYNAQFLYLSSPARWECWGCYWQTVPPQWGGARLFAASEGPPHKNGRNSETKSQKIEPKVPKRLYYIKRRGLQTRHCSVLVWNVSYAILQYCKVLYCISL